MRAAACGRGPLAGPLGGSRTRRAAIVAAAPGGERRSGGSGSSAARRTGSAPNRRGAAARKAPPAKQQQGRQQPAKGKKQQQAGEDPALVQPLRWQSQGEISASERMPAPYWSTFCGVSNGLWCGVTQAVSPSTGQPEPLALDERGKPLLQLHQCCVEERVVEEEGDGADWVVRHVARASSLEGLQREMVQGGQLVFPACGVPGAGSGGPAVSECWDEERFSSCQEGLVVFDGGSYSLGPGTMGSPAEPPVKEELAFDEAAAAAAAAALEAAMAARPAADSIDLAEGGEAAAEEENKEEVGGSREEEDREEAAAAAAALKLAKEETAEFDWTAVVIEHCMQWGGEQRLRIRLTLDTAGGADGTELEVQPLRVAVAREAWEGLPGSFTPAEQGAGAAEQQEASRRVRLDAGALAGHWKVFEVSAVTVDDVSMQTGLPTRSTLYSAHETSRRLGPAPEGGKGEDEGALLLLPHSAGVQLEALRLDNGRRRGLRVSTHWSPQPDMLLSMARLYDADGKLLEVSTSTAIRDAAADLAERSI